MRISWLLGLLVAAVFGTTLGAQAAPQRWVRVATTAGFSVERPLGWQTLPNTPAGTVEIISGACRPTAVALCKDQAMIVVFSQPVVAKRTALHSRACWSLEETRAETEDYPGTRAQSTSLFCTISDRRFRILERHWKGDKRAASYGRIAMRMAKSLRYPG